jgi:hypothetical protein
MGNTSTKYLVVTAVLLFGFAPQRDPSECDAVEGNLIFNCGWETNCWAGWHPTASIVDIGRDGRAHSGDYYGIMYAHPGIEYIGAQGLPAEVGQAYTLTFWVRTQQALDRLQVIWTTEGVDTVVLDLQNVPAMQDYTQFVVQNLNASSDYVEVWLGFANALSQIDIDDVVLVASQ